MTRDELLKRFPNASATFLRNNGDNSPVRQSPAPIVERDLRTRPLAAVVTLDTEPQKVDKDNMQFDIEAMFEAYLRTGSVHRAAIEFKTTGETVRKHLLNAGKSLNRKKWTDKEIEQLRYAYSMAGGFNLPTLAMQIGRTYAAVACKADELGLCCLRGKHMRTEQAIQNTCKAQKEVSSRPEIQAARKAAVIAAFARNGHPKGMLGKCHSEDAKQKISAGNTGHLQTDDHIEKRLKTTLEKHGTLAPFGPGQKRKWKAEWVTIGGKKFFSRSKWEANYAKILEWMLQNGHIKQWEHEPKTFWFEGIKRGCCSYLPDFRVVTSKGIEEYHEVKGWMDPRSITKIARMAKYFPAVRLVVIDSARYRTLAKQFQSLLK